MMFQRISLIQTEKATKETFLDVLQTRNILLEPRVIFQNNRSTFCIFVPCSFFRYCITIGMLITYYRKQNNNKSTKLIIINTKCYQQRLIKFRTLHLEDYLQSQLISALGIMLYIPCEYSTINPHFLPRLSDHQMELYPIHIEKRNLKIRENISIAPEFD